MPVKKPRFDKRALDKLQDATLREKVVAGGGEAISVILEVDLPRQQVEVVSREERLRGTTSLARAVVAEGPEQQRLNADRVARTREHIEQVLGTSPRWLASARAFVFRAMPEQLLKLAAFELTRAVRLNRRLDR